MCVAHGRKLLKTNRTFKNLNVSIILPRTASNLTRVRSRILTMNILRAYVGMAKDLGTTKIFY